MTVARAFPEAFKAALRSRGVLASLAPVVVMVMVYTILHRTAALAAESAQLAEKLLPEREALQVVESCSGDGCASACVVEARHGGYAANLTLIVAPGRVLGLEPPREGVSLGVEAAEALNASKGDTVTLEHGGIEWEVRVERVHRSHSALDVAAVASGAPFPCRDWLLAPSMVGGGAYAGALAAQVSGALGEWSLLALPALALASAVAAGKARVDLEGAAAALEEMGIPARLLALAVASLAGLAALSGYAYGVVAFDAIASLAGSLAGAYLPPPPPTPAEAVTSALVPAALASASALAGWAAWRR